MEYNQARECEDCERSSTGTPDAGGVAAQVLDVRVLVTFLVVFTTFFHLAWGRGVVLGYNYEKAWAATNAERTRSSLRFGNLAARN
ncbi:MAG TPA: hypothetical protein VK175_09485 [Leadbetterella sp.]|nr:hypothetical protein [Leadbetterella sp.]